MELRIEEREHYPMYEPFTLEDIDVGEFFFFVSSPNTLRYMAGGVEAKEYFTISDHEEPTVVTTTGRANARVIYAGEPKFTYTPVKGG